MTIHDETDALTVRAGRRVTSDSTPPTALDVRERGLRLAGMAAVVGTGATITLIIGGLSFYAAYDIDALGRWPVWAVSLAAWGTYEAFHGRRQARVVTDG